MEEEKKNKKSTTKSKTTKKKTKTVKAKEVNEKVEQKEELKEKVIIEEKKEEPKEKIKDEDSNKFSPGEVIIVMILSLILGLVLGGFVVSTRYSSKGVKNVEGDVNYIFDNISKDFYGEYDKKKLNENSIYGMLNSLNDPYATYISKEDVKTYNENLEGEFVGIGVEILQEENNYPVVQKVFEGGPSEKAGVQVNDVIVKVEGEDIAGLNINDIVSKIKINKPGSKVKITVRREEQDIELEIERARVISESVSVSFENRNNRNIAIVSISSLTKNTFSEFKKAYEKIKKENADGIILDLRNNTGGYMSAAKNIASMFLDKNSVIYKTESKGGKEVIKDYDKQEIKLETVIVVNCSTASGAEMLAATLSENLGFKVVGGTTYGNGRIQKVYELNNGALVKFTTARWLTPNGVDIEGNGVSIDEIVTDEDSLDTAFAMFDQKI